MDHVQFIEDHSLKIFVKFKSVDYNVMESLGSERQMNEESNRRKGSRYEEKAADFLSRCGYEILERNYRTRFGEIDLIGKEGNYFVFIEVKYRSNDQMGLPEEAVDYKKQRKIYHCANVYLMEHRL